MTETVTWWMVGVVVTLIITFAILNCVVVPLDREIEEQVGKWRANGKA